MEADDLTVGSSTPIDQSVGSRVIGVGLDLVDVRRFETALVRTPGLATRLFTEPEWAYCESARNRAERFAVRFAAKEAAMKALRVGLGAIDWHDIEVARSAGGAPSLLVTGRAADLATSRGGTGWMVSLTHTASDAQAIVLLLG